MTLTKMQGPGADRGQRHDLRRYEICASVYIIAGCAWLSNALSWPGSARC